MASAARRNMMVARVEASLRRLQARMDHIDQFVGHFLQASRTARHWVGTAGSPKVLPCGAGPAPTAVMEASFLALLASVHRTCLLVQAARRSTSPRLASRQQTACLPAWCGAQGPFAYIAGERESGSNPHVSMLPGHHLLDDLAK